MPRCSALLNQTRTPSGSVLVVWLVRDALSHGVLGGESQIEVRVTQ
jgi:hypothetical protein